MVTLLPPGIQTWKVIVAPAVTSRFTPVVFTDTDDVPAAVPLKFTASDCLPAKCCAVEIATPAIGVLPAAQSCRSVSKLNCAGSGLAPEVVALASGAKPAQPELLTAATW